MYLILYSPGTLYLNDSYVPYMAPIDAPSAPPTAAPVPIRLTQFFRGRGECVL